MNKRRYKIEQGLTQIFSSHDISPYSSPGFCSFSLWNCTCHAKNIPINQTILSSRPPKNTVLCFRFWSCDSVLFGDDLVLISFMVEISITCPDVVRSPFSTVGLPFPFLPSTAQDSICRRGPRVPTCDNPSQSDWQCPCQIQPLKYRNM
jgi:hypothetical protein